MTEAEKEEYRRISRAIKAPGSFSLEEREVMGRVL